ncbi:XRE family transcriptional regulator [Streptomyces sp. H27-C3]|uniref:XRE family transcriptional regulator n=1 Tax=Streptomyces sp. H27-C3 TaxID=3046305 RepID=UPI0024B88777|nr:XRE family transcriptional regulator [Streptomyces sp. H27-C3]MDJ0460652.1 XRE family transcriptional regulator [Streptomyces sp. H27-C3]
MPKVLRKREGQPLRDEITRQGLTLDKLAEMTKAVDPEGRGVSPATIGRLTGTGRTARDRCELNTAWLITEGLDARMHRLFSMPTHSTATVERSRANV